MRLRWEKGISGVRGGSGWKTGIVKPNFIIKWIDFLDQWHCHGG